MLSGATLLYLDGAHRVPLWDRDEPRYAQCSREMLQSGDWVVPKYLGQWRLEKPPLIYWCQAVAMMVEGQTSEAARFPSTAAVVLTALILGVAVRHFTGDRRALWSVLIFSTSGLAIASAKFCITDAMMMLWVATGQACLAFLYAAAMRRRRSPSWAAPVFWISLALAGLTKGPQSLGMHAMLIFILLLMDVGREGFKTKGAWRRAMAWWPRLRPEVGVPILAIILAPWLIKIHHQAPGFVWELLHKAERHTASSMEGHGEPPGYHMLLIFGTFYPWSLLLPTAAVLAWKNQRLATVRFAIAATAGPWLFMECIWTKLPFYILPAFPGLAFLTADALVRCIRGQYRDLRRPGFRAATVVWTIVTLGLAGVPWLTKLVHNPGALPIAGMTAFSVIGGLYALIVCVRFFQGRIARASVILGIGMAIMIAILYVAILPNFKFLQLSERLANDLQRIGCHGSNSEVAMIGYQEPSLAFYQGGGTRERDDDFLAVNPPDLWPQWIVITQALWERTPQPRRQLLAIRAEESGVNYSHAGENQTVLVLEKVTEAK